MNRSSPPSVASTRPASLIIDCVVVHVSWIPRAAVGRTRLVICAGDVDCHELREIVLLESGEYALVERIVVRDDVANI